MEKSVHIVLGVGSPNTLLTGRRVVKLMNKHNGQVLSKLLGFLMLVQDYLILL